MNTNKLFKGFVLSLAGMATLALALIVDVAPVAAHGVNTVLAASISFRRHVHHDAHYCRH